jgi:universal stress protein E
LKDLHMPQILAATDFSERSNRAVRRAGMLARQLGARLMLLHVVDDDRPERLVIAETAAAHEFLNATIAPMSGDVQCEAIVESGDPFDRIAKIATAKSVDLIVMGAHRKQILLDIFIGTSIERVARQRVAPVLMVNTEPAGPYERSLAAVDLSEHSGYALQTARTLGVLSRSQVVVVYAFQALAKGKLGYAGVAPDVIAKHVEQTASDSRSELKDFLARIGGNLEQFAIRVKEGLPVPVISEVANTVQADIVVMGAHGRSAILKLLLGSVTEEIMRSLDRDILVVPPRRHDTSGA